VKGREYGVHTTDDGKRGNVELLGLFSTHQNQRSSSIVDLGGIGCHCACIVDVRKKQKKRIAKKIKEEKKKRKEKKRKEKKEKKRKEDNNKLGRVMS
jgi:hypothetical protein